MRPACDATLRVDATIDGPATERIGLRVVAARLSDGWKEECLLDEESEPALELPAGRYQIVAWVTGDGAPPATALFASPVEDTGAGEAT